MMLNRRFARMGDLVAGTLVVYAAKAEAIAAESVGATRPPPVALSFDEQRAFVDFLDRRERLSGERQVELAGILAPVLHVDREQALDEVGRVAAGIRGEP